MKHHRFIIIALLALLSTSVHAATLTVAPDFPQNNSYVFVCAAESLTPTAYDWIFGDGEQLLNVTNDNVYHTFTSPGLHAVICSPTNGTDSETAVLAVDIIPPVTPKVTLTIAEWYPKNSSYVFFCTPEGFNPTEFNWTYGDDQKLINITNNNTYHTFTTTGQYTITCSATDGTNVANTSLTIDVTVEEEETAAPAAPRHRSFNSGSASGECAWGYVRQDDRCVKVAVVQEPVASEQPAQPKEEVVTPAPVVETHIETQTPVEQDNLITGNVVTAEPKAPIWPWFILALFVLVAALIHNKF